MRSDQEKFFCKGILQMMKELKKTIYLEIAPLIPNLFDFKKYYLSEKKVRSDESVG